MLMLKATCRIASVLAVLVLALVSLWAAVSPVTAFAADATAKCRDNSIRFCSGISCQSQDSTSGSTGYCACTKKDGSVEVKFCNDGPPIEESAY